MFKEKSEQLQEILTSATGILDVIQRKVYVTCPESETRARAVYADLRAKVKDQTAKYDEFLKPLSEGLKKLKADCKASVEPFQQAAQLISDRVGVYRAELDAKQKELETQAAQLSQQGQNTEALALVQEANQHIVVEQVKGAGLGQAVNVTVTDFKVLIGALYHLATPQDALRPGFRRELTAWAKAEAKKGTTLPGVEVHTATTLTNR